MSSFFRSLSACLFGLALSPLLTAPASAVNILAQGPCAYSGPVCLTFDSTTSPIPVIRTFAFTMPAAGKALVRFDGTMQCVVNSTASNSDVIDLASQIVPGAATVPVYTGPGGNRHAMRPHHNGYLAAGPSASVNLAASRLFTYPSGGNKVVRFKINPLRMDPGTSCSVFAAAFSVTTIP